MTENETMFHLLFDIAAKIEVAKRTVKQYRRPGLDTFTEDFLDRVDTELHTHINEYNRLTSVEAGHAAAAVYKGQERVVTNG